MNSSLKKGKSIIEHGIEPIEKGMENYRLDIPEVEEKARERFEVCRKCPELENEPIDFLKVKDSRIKGASEKMCGVCGCAIALLLRQDVKKCDKWGE